jgi:hypothetical protein
MTEFWSRFASAVLAAVFVTFTGAALAASSGDQDPNTPYNCTKYPKDVRCRS